MTTEFEQILAEEKEKELRMTTNDHEQYIAYLRQCLAKHNGDALRIAEMLQDAYDNEDGYDY